MRSAVQLLKDAFGIFTNNPNLFIAIFAVPTLLSLLLVAADPFMNQYFTSADTLSGIMVVAFLALITIIITVNIMAGIAMVTAVSGTATSAGDAYRKARQYFWKYIALAFLMTLVLFGAYLLLIVPGVIATVWFVFAYLILILEDTSIVDALKRSKSYVKGKWWAIAWRMSFLMIFAFIFTFAYTFVGSFLAYFTHDLALSVITILSNVVFVPVAAAYLFGMYTDVKNSTVTEVSDAG